MGERKLLFLMNAKQARAFARLLSAAEIGDGHAACELGDMYREGAGGLRYSPKETHRWYARSAMTGYANGQNNLGACYEHGLGCVQSYPKAVTWYRRAADQHLGTASMNLGLCYVDGRGVPVGREQAVRLLRLAVGQGEARAVEELERLGESISTPKSWTNRRVKFIDETREGALFGIVGAPGSAKPSSINGEREYGCNVCWPEEAEAAREAQTQLERTAELIQEYRFKVTLLRCGSCRQVYVRIYTELSDFPNGNDSMARMTIPVEPEEVALLNTMRPEEVERKVYGIGTDRRSLWWVWPRDSGQWCSWSRGLAPLPHD